MHRTPTPAPLVAILLLAVTLVFVPPARAADTSELRVQRTVILADLENPWDLAVAPDGALFFTEKCRGLSVRTPEGTVRHLFGASGAAVAADDLFCSPGPRQLWGDVAKQMPISVALGSGAGSLVFSIG